MNWFLAATAGPLGSTEVTPGLQHIWSLSFEEQFYLVWPFVTALALTAVRRLRTVVIVCVVLMVLVGLHRARLYHSGMNWYPIFIRTDTRFDSFLPGVLLAHLWFRHREPKGRFVPIAGWVALGILLVCLPTAKLEDPFLYYGGITLIDICCAVVILAIIDGRWAVNRFFQLKWLVRLGTVSYGLYLWHLPVFFAFAHYYVEVNMLTGTRTLSISPWILAPAALAVSFAFTLLSWFLLEKPVLQWKRRLEGRPSDSLSPDLPTDVTDAVGAEAGRPTSAFSARGEGTRPG
jgi:peptidoglycan/LPS O-acetylase OafA/YrhL